jgi:hypothetical protein
MTDFQEPGQDPTKGSGVPTAGDEGRDSQPTQLHPVDAPRHDHDDYDTEDGDKQEKDADFDAEEKNTKEGSA